MNKFKELREESFPFLEYLLKYLNEEEIKAIGFSEKLFDSKFNSLGRFSSIAYYPYSANEANFQKTLDILNDESELSKRGVTLHKKAVILGLNAGIADNGINPIFSFFHEPGTRAVKYKRVFNHPEVVGAYMTDAFKALPTTDGEELKALISSIEKDLGLKEDDLFKRLSKAFKDILVAELSLIEGDEVIIYALGGVNDSESAMSKFIRYSNLSNEFKVVRIPHYTGPYSVKYVLDIMGLRDV